MADRASTSIKDLVNKVLEAQKQEQIAQRAHQLVTNMSDAAGIASQRAAEAWRDSAALRRETSRTVARAGREATRWGRTTWRRDLAPGLRDLISKRTLTFGAAGAVAPAVSELVGDAAARLGIGRRREERHWGSFFLGLLLGAAAGAVAALLTAPKAGRQMRDELAMTAREAAGKAREAALQARDAAADVAANASDWMPIFQRNPVDTDSAEPVVEEAAPTPVVKSAKPRAQVEPPATN